MHILKLEAENVKRLEAVTITPDGNMVVIGGQNGAGKSSVLDCIEYALGGKSRICDVPLHRGADKGYIILETDTYTVKRTFTEKDSYIEVKSKDGFKASNPQDLLNTLVGDLSFDPLEFTRMDAKRQAATFMRLLNLDFSKLDSEYQQIEQERRDLGRDGKQIKALLDSIPEDPEAPEAEVAVSDLVQQLDVARQTNDENARLHRLRDEAAGWVDRQKGIITDLEAQLTEAREALTVYVADYEQAQKAAAGCVDVDTAPLQEQIANAEGLNKRARAAKQRKEYAAQYEQAKASYEKLTDRLRAIEADKAKQIAEAKFPVAGVSFSPDGVLVNDLPFEQASSAEQLRIAVAMGFAANPKLRIVLIRDGSLLDEQSLAAVSAMAEQYDAQVWMERVGEGKEVSVVIKDGRVATDPAVQLELAG